MLRFILLALVAGLFTSATAHSEVQTYFGFHVGVTNAPDPPPVVFESEPRVVLVPETRVYIVREESFDEDLFRYGGAWYLFSGGNWFRASRYRGPYRCVDVRVVPTAILRVPAHRWRNHPHGGPPGLAKKASPARASGTQAVVVREKHRGKRGR